MTAIGVAHVPLAHRLDLADTTQIPATFPDCPAFCTRDHRRDVGDEFELRLHERCVLEVESHDAESIRKPASARVVVERCDAPGPPAAPARIVLGIGHPDAPDADDVDVDVVTRGLSDATCRSLAAMLLAGGAVTGMALSLDSATSRKLGDALRQAADWVEAGPR